MDRDFYSVSPAVDPVGSTSGTRRARRGADRKFKQRFRSPDHISGGLSAFRADRGRLGLQAVRKDPNWNDLLFQGRPFIAQLEELTAGGLEVVDLDVVDARVEVDVSRELRVSV